MTISDWSKATRPIPVPNEWTKPFWDAAKQGVLALQRCQACGHFQHPPYATCVNCMSIDLKFEPVAGNLLEAPYTEAKVGRRVEVIFQPLNDDFTLPQFRLAHDVS